MSWKSLVCAGLLCALVSPAWAQPTLSVINPTIGGDENWHWNVGVTPDGVGAVDAELAVTASNSGLVSVGEPNSGVWDHEVPVDKPDISPAFDFWSEFTDFGVDSSGDNAIVGLGSGPVTDGVHSQIVDVVTQEPFYVNSGNHRLTTTIQVYGGYSGDTAGRFAQNSANNDVSGTFQYYVLPGDANLDGSVGFADNNIWLANTGTNLTWTGADYNDDDSIGFADKAIWLAAPNPGPGPPVPGAGAGSGSAAVPEPSSLALAGLMGLGLLLVRRVRGL